MANYERTGFDNHHEVWELLPWYVNGSLDAEEKALFERHARGCISCRAELEAQHSVSTEVKEVDVEVLAVRSAFRDLDERINRTAATRVSSRWLARAVRAWAQRLRLTDREVTVPAAMVAAALAVTVVFALGSRIDWGAYRVGEYRTLTTTDQRVVAGNRDVRVVFSDRLTLSEVKETLKPLNAKIVDGPSGQGVFLVRIGDRATDFRDLVKTISSLRADRNVIFAEPAFPMPALNESQ